MNVVYPKDYFSKPIGKLVGACAPCAPMVPLPMGIAVVCAK